MVCMTATRTAALAWFLVAAACGPAQADTPSPTATTTATTTAGEPGTALRPEAVRGEVPDRARIADYVIDARLDAEQHQVTGTVRISWRNTSTRAVDSLPLHLYMNGFRAEDTAWMSEARGAHRGVQQSKDGAWGYIDLKAARLLGRGRDAELGQIEAGRGAVAARGRASDRDRGGGPGLGATRRRRAR